MADPPDLDRIRSVLSGRAPRADRDASKRAAVATVLRQPRHEPEVLLIRRAEHPDDPWSGHMAFPGGRHDPDDRDLEHTARRETREEVGLDLGARAVLLGRLDDIPAIGRGRPTGIVITPYVFSVGGDDPDLRTNHEVAEALWAPLGPLMRGEADTTLPYRHGDRVHPMPAFDVEGRIVWGLTYQMLQHLFRVLRSG